MKMKPERLDIISTLPQPILETILCLLPTRQAARTSILSREWRYKWTTIPKLELSHSKRCVSVSEQTSGIVSRRRNMDMRCKGCYNIHQILLLHQGPIHELNLLMLDEYCFELNQIIMYLSRNHPVKKLTLSGWVYNGGYTVPLSIFSFHHLTYLDILCLDLNRPPIFNGFGNLGSLNLWGVGISKKTLLHLLSNCPSLKNFTLLVSDSNVSQFVSESRDKCTINELIECLPVIEHLTTWHHVSKLVRDSVPQELPTLLIHLKYLSFEEMCFVEGCGLPILLVFIKCSSNLEKVKLQNDWCNTCHRKYSVVWEEYSDVWLEHLNELEIGCFSNSKPEMEFVKFILARSPKLKKVIDHTQRG